MATWNTYIWVDSADETAAKARDAGGGVAMEPFDVLDSGRMAVLTDPEGAAFFVWQAMSHKGATVVNEHGSLNFNGLATRDPGGAEAFYGAVFGWQTLALPAGGCGRCPATATTSRRAAPVFASRSRRWVAPRASSTSSPRSRPIADDDSETPPHWSVTFGVDDAEATAAKATELGGEVVAGPLDAPWTKLAVIKDPQGATFIASQFVAENQDLEA